MDWFFGSGAQAQMFKSADGAGVGLAQGGCVSYVARDVQCDVGVAGTGRKARVVKEYQWFNSHRGLAKFLDYRYQCGIECCLYELIRERHPCRLYLDVEFVSKDGDAKAAHHKLDVLVGLLREDVRKRYADYLPDGEQVRVCVLDGSRQSSKEGRQCKYSYHVLLPDLIFPNNTCEMKFFVEHFVEAHVGVDDLYWTQVKGGKEERRSIVDLGVYTKNRCFRTVYSHKVDDVTQTKLMCAKRMSSNGAWVRCDVKEDMEILDLFVTHVPHGSPIVRSASTFASEEASAYKKRKKPGGGLEMEDRQVRDMLDGREKKRKAWDEGEADPETRAKYEAMAQHLQRFLLEKGIRDFRVASVLGKTSAGNMVYSCRNEGTRKCLSNERESHESNNCFIKHVLKDNRGAVYYKCLAPSCALCEPFLIGKLMPL